MRRPTLTLALLLAASLLTPAPAEAAVPAQVLSQGYSIPWGLSFLPDGTALVSERATARVMHVFRDGRRAHAATVARVVPGGEGGLLGIAVSPTYATDRWVYAYYTSSTDNRIVRFHLGSNGQQTLLTGIPKGSNHNGGRIAFGPDGMLYAGTGDAGDTANAQNRNSLGGKVLRIQPNGQPAVGNPWRTPVWSLGHRNVQGLAWDNRKQLWATEFGQNTYDEVNLIVRAGNYGWPNVEGPGTGGGRYVAPKVVWQTSESSPSGVAYAGGELHVAALRGQRLWDVVVRSTSVGKPVARYVGTYGRIRSATTEPGGQAIWLTTSNCDGRGTCPSYKDRVIRVPL